MIRFAHVHKSYRLPRSRRIVLDDASFDIPTGSRLGVLGVNGAGKSTLIRLIAGVEHPDSGTIERRCRVSFPLGFGGTFHPKLTGRENVAFLAQLYGADQARVAAAVADFAELGDYFKMPLETYSAGMQARLAFAVCLAIDFDLFLVDEVTAVGDARFAARCRAAFDARIGRSDLVMVSHNLHTIREYCDRGAVLSDGRLDIFSNLDDAISAYNDVLRRTTTDIRTTAI